MTQSIALVVSDVDGTLTNRAGAISPANHREIMRIMSRGIHFSIATGRPTRDLQKVREGLDLALPVIVSNGTMIEDLATGEIIHSLQIEMPVIRAVLDLIVSHDVDAVIMDTPQGWIYQVRNARASLHPGSLASAIRHTASKSGILTSRKIGRCSKYMSKEPSPSCNELRRYLQ